MYLTGSRPFHAIMFFSLLMTPVEDAMIGFLDDETFQFKKEVIKYMKICHLLSLVSQIVASGKFFERLTDHIHMNKAMFESISLHIQNLSYQGLIFMIM